MGFAKYANCCGLIFMEKRHTMKSIKIYTVKNFYAYNIDITNVVTSSLLRADLFLLLLQLLF